MVNASPSASSPRTSPTTPPPSLPANTKATAVDAYEPLRKAAKPVAGFFVGLSAGAMAWPVAGLSLCSAGSALACMSPPLAFISVLATGKDKKMPLAATIPAACITAASMVPLGGLVVAEGLFLLAASPVLAPMTAASCALAGAYTWGQPGAFERADG